MNTNNTVECSHWMMISFDFYFTYMADARCNGCLTVSNSAFNRISVLASACFRLKKNTHSYSYTHTWKKKPRQRGKYNNNNTSSSKYRDERKKIDVNQYIVEKQESVHRSFGSSHRTAHRRHTANTACTHKTTTRRYARSKIKTSVNKPVRLRSTPFVLVPFHVCKHNARMNQIHNVFIACLQYYIIIRFCFVWTLHFDCAKCRGRSTKIQIHVQLAVYVQVLMIQK